MTLGGVNKMLLCREKRRVGNIAAIGSSDEGDQHKSATYGLRLLIAMVYSELYC